MKYLKRINESVDEEELRSFCEDYLSYLIDDGFKVVIEYHNILNIDFIAINIVKKVRVGDGEILSDFEWSEIKDYLVPFVVMLNKSYTLNTTWRDNTCPITVRETFESREYSYESFIENVDNYYFDDDEISYIQILLDNK